MGALCIGEGVETVLAAVQQPELPKGTSFGSSMGAWATGGASRLPKVATAIARLPFIEWVTICRESEPKAYAAANELAQELKRRRRDIENRFQRRGAQVMTARDFNGRQTMMTLQSEQGDRRGQT